MNFFSRSYEYNEAMLRAIAIMLINIISFGWLLPAMPSGANISVPACCREHGKHQCAMKMAHRMESQADASDSIHILYEKCPYSPKGWTTASSSQASTLNCGQLFFGDVLSHPALQAQTEARYRVSFSRSRQKRGPPSVLFS